MSVIGPRIHLFEINDQTWYALVPKDSAAVAFIPTDADTSILSRFPQYFREKVQSCLTVAWIFQVPILQGSCPAQLVTTTLHRVLSESVTEYTYVDFCAGAGGPTPFMEQDLNAKLRSSDSRLPVAPATSTGRIPKSRKDATTQGDDGVKFILTDLHPHIPEWVEASEKSRNLSFVAFPVDAANAPMDLINTDGKRTFRLFNLAFHHFEDNLARAILKNTFETADGFGIFELQERTLTSLFMIFLLGFLFLLITPLYFWRSPGHLFFTYIIPIVPFVLIFDGYVSSLRTRSADEVQALIKSCGTSTDGWTIKYGRECHTWPIGYVTWVIGVKA